MKKQPVLHIIILTLLFLLTSTLCRATVCDIAPDTLTISDTLEYDSILVEKTRDTTVIIPTPPLRDSLSINSGISRQRSDNMFVFSYKNLRHYLLHNISYPAQAYYEGIEGTVLVEFVIETDGTIGEANAVQSVHPLLDAEAIRLVKNMPRWVPLKLNGEPIRVSHTIPVIFKISETSEEE